MSLDGFIADVHDEVGAPFDWYGNGDVAVTGADPERVFHTTAVTAAYLREAWSNVGATVIGRRLFDLTGGGTGAPPVSAGRQRRAHRRAGGAGRSGGRGSRRPDAVPVVFGAGVRFFGDYAGSPLLLDDPRIVQGDRVTHLHYRMRK